MPQPQTLHCPRRCPHSLATWQPTEENTGHHGWNAGCPGPGTRNKPSNFAPPTYKSTQTNFEVCTDPVRDKDRHTASFKTATHQSQPRSQRQNNPSQSGGVVQGEQASRPAGPKGPSPSQKRPQCHHRPIYSRSQRPRRAHSSRWRNVPPCIQNAQRAREYKGFFGPRSKDNRSNLYGPGAKYRADWPLPANMATCN